MNGRGAAFLALMVVVAGCSGGEGGGGGGGGISWADYGGSINLEAYDDPTFPELYLDAFLFSDIEFSGPAPSRIKEPVIGDCVDESDDGSSGSIPTLTYLDAGSQLTASGNGFSMVADLVIDAGFQSYEGTVSSDGTGTFTVSASGGADVAAGVIATINVPGPTTVTGTPVVVPGDPLEVSYSAPAGTVLVEIDLSHSIEDIYWTCYADPAETSFTVPGSVTGHFDADAYVDVFGQWYEVTELAGKTVVLSGESYEF